MIPIIAFFTSFKVLGATLHITAASIVFKSMLLFNKDFFKNKPKLWLLAEGSLAEISLSLPLKAPMVILVFPMSQVSIIFLP